MKSLWIFVFSIFFANLAAAGELRCSFTEIYKLSNDGVVETVSKTPVEKTIDLDQPNWAVDYQSEFVDIEIRFLQSLSFSYVSAWVSGKISDQEQHFNSIKPKMTVQVDKQISPTKTLLSIEVSCL